MGPQQAEGAGAQAVFGTPLAFVHHSVEVGAVQRYMTGDGHTDGTAYDATRAARRLSLYGSVCLPASYLQALVLFLLGAALLARNTLHSLTIVERVCPYCRNHDSRLVVEDEFHAVIECPLYTPRRGRSYSDTSRSQPSLSHHLLLTKCSRAS